MQVILVFAAHFRQMLKLDEIPVVVPEDATVSDAVAAFLRDHPERRRILEERKGFRFGALKAIYSVGGDAVQPDTRVRPGDRVSVMKAFIGG